MPITKKSSSADECCAKCESDISELRKQIEDLKRELAKKSSGGPGADSRVDAIIKALTKNPSWVWAKDIEKLK